MVSRIEQVPFRPLILRKDNYPVWRIRIESLLKSRSLWQIASRQYNIPDIYAQQDIQPSTSSSVITTDGQPINVNKTDVGHTADDNALAEKNAMAIEIIQSTLESRDIIGTGMCQTAFEVMNQLKATYQGLSLNAQANAQEAFYNIKYSPRESIHEFVTRFELALNTLLMSGLNIQDSNKIFMFTRSLPETYKNHARVWSRTKKDMDDIDDLFGYIKNIALEETSTEEEDEYAMLSYGKHNAKPAYDKEKRDATGKKKFCTYCKLDNHVWQDCRKRLNGRKRSNKRSGEQNEKNHHVSQNKDSDNSQVELDILCMATEIGEKLDPSLWVVDTGASAHATPHSHIIDVTSSTPSHIGLGDGHRVEVKSKGKFRFGGGELSDVRVVPSLKYNLFSPVAIMKFGLEMTAKNDLCTISKDGRVIWEIPKSPNGLFLLKLVPRKNDAFDVALVGATQEVWHKRFCHSDPNMLKALISKQAASGIEIITKEMIKCQDCALAKVQCTSHKSAVSKTLKDGHYILHADTAGPMPTKSLANSRYMVLGCLEPASYLLVDFVATKDLIPNTVIKFITKIGNIREKKIIALQTDNGTEFKNKKLGKYLEENFIEHKTSVAYVPQQNGKIERQIKTITNRASAMLIDSKMPPELWAEACKTTVDVTNLLLAPNSDKTRHELFFGIKPNLSFLRFFGEPAVIKTFPKPAKFEPKGRIAKFVGYTQKENT